MNERKGSGRSSGRYGWVDVAKGICIVAVVCLYARREFVHSFGSAGWLEPWTAFARPFRMPDFFLLSGLFLGAVINRPWRSYLDTKVVHYIYFLMLWVGIIYIYDLYFSESLRNLEQTPLMAVRRYVYYLYSPEHMLWFIQTLPAFFVVTRLLQKIWPGVLMALAAILMLLRVNTHVPPIDNFCMYYVFFLTGYLGAPRIFRMADWAGAHRPAAWLMFVVWIGVNQFAVVSGWTDSSAGALTFGFLGIAAIISLSRLVSDLNVAAWVRYLGANSIVVYLGFYIPLTLFTELYKSSGWQWHINVVTTVIVALSTVAPVLLFEATKNTPMRWLFRRPHWAHLQRGSLARSVAV